MSSTAPNADSLVPLANRWTDPAAPIGVARSGHASTSKSESSDLYAHFNDGLELSQDPLMLRSGHDLHCGLFGSTSSTHADSESWLRSTTSAAAVVGTDPILSVGDSWSDGAGNIPEDDKQLELLGSVVNSWHNQSSLKRKREGDEEGESDMSLRDIPGNQEEDAEATFDFELSTQEEAVLLEVEERYAEEKRLEEEMGKGRVRAEEAVGFVDSRSALEDAWRTVRADEGESSKMANEVHKATKPAVKPDPEVVRQRRREALTRAIVGGVPESSSGKGCVQASNDDHVMKEERLEVQGQRIKEQAKAREERRKRRQEMKQQRHPPPIERKPKRKNRRENRERRKREHEAEMARLRECEKELLILRASQIQGIAVPRLGEIHQKHQTVDTRARTPNRVRVLRRARQEQELGKGAEDQSAARDANRPTASASTVVVKEEQRTQFLDHVVPEAEEDSQPNITGGGAFALRTSGEEDEDGKFHFELVLDLKGIGDHRRNESKDSSTSLPDGAGGSMPIITKVAIALESNTEYRISVSGERPMKHGRGGTQL